jgi:ABC-type multidrug transport system fused ATPase/permease subunit
MTPFSSWPLLAALVFVAMGMAFVRQSWRKYRRWPRVRGRVVALVRVAVLKVPEIEYLDAAGVSHRFVSRMPYHQRLKVGETVEVAVDPEDGSQAERVNVITAVVMPALMVAFGVIVILFWLGVTRR